MAIILILILGLVLRLYNLNQSLWLDESTSAIITTKMWDIWIPLIHGDFHPPLFHLMLHGWTGVFGATEIALRMPSVLLGVGSVFLAYLLAKEIGGKKLGIIAALFLATAPYHIYYSQEARMYSLVTFFSLASIYGFWKVLKQGGRWWIFYIIATILAIYSDYFSFLILFFENLWFFFITAQRSMRLKNWLIAQALIIISFLPWIPIFLKQLETGRWATDLLPGWINLVNLSVVRAIQLTFTKFSLGRISFDNKELYIGIVLVIFIFYAFLALRSFFPREAGSRFTGQKKVVFFVWGYLAIPIILALIMSLFTPLYQPFRLLLVLPAFYLILALGIVAFQIKKLEIFLAALVVGINLFGLSVYYTNSKFWREDWRGTVGYIEAQNKDNAITVLPSYTSQWPYIYYAKNTPYVGIVELKSSKEFINEKLEQEVGKRQQVFYINYLEPLFDPQSEIENWFTSAGFNKKDVKNFNGVTVEEFIK